MKSINFDHISANPLLPEVKETMIDAIQKDYHNPSSQHRDGEEAADALEQARKSVAKLLNAAMPKEIVFTSGVSGTRMSRSRQAPGNDRHVGPVAGKRLRGILHYGSQSGTFVVPFERSSAGDKFV